MSIEKSSIQSALSVHSVCSKTDFRTLNEKETNCQQILFQGTEIFTGVFNTYFFGEGLTNPSVTNTTLECDRPWSDRVVLLAFILAN